MERLEILIKGAVAAGGGFIFYWLGGLDTLLVSLTVLMVLDYATGILKAIHNKNLSSDIGRKGITKKVMSLIIVAVAFIIEDITTHALPLREIVIMFFIANEGISILENYAQMDGKLPAALKNALDQLKGKVES